MDLEETIRALIAQEQTTGLKLNLRQIAQKTGVGYKRLWHFLSKTQPGKLSIQDAQQVYEKLSGKPLLIESHE